LVSTCDIIPIANARALAHMDRFFMNLPFYSIAAMSGGLFGYLTRKAKPPFTDGNSSTLRIIDTPYSSPLGP
jgi:hypothetical protein